MPFISLIIPCFNTETSVVETLESVERQTFKDFEVICINDGS
jgi:glycosyltransferase involved in cell wall biosynthesis